jgi:hypothetical protein
MNQWESDKFLNCTIMDVNSNNPLTFNTTSDANYVSLYLKVFCHQLVAKVPAELYNKFKLDSSLDENHTIGKCFLCDIIYCFILVLYRSALHFGRSL